MSKKPLKEVVERFEAPILESGQSEDGFFRFTAVLSEADVINKNGRVYPRPILEAAILEAKAHRNEAENRVLKVGKNEHPDRSYNATPASTGLSANAVVWEDIWMEDSGRVLGRGRTIETAAGKDLEANIKARSGVGFSKRGLGRFEEDFWSGSIAQVAREYVLVTVDAVDDPSHNTSVLSYGESVEETLEEIVSESLLKELQESVLAAKTEAITAKFEAELKIASAKLEAAESVNTSLTNVLEATKAEVETYKAKVAELEAELAELPKVAAIESKINSLLEGNANASAIKLVLADLADAGAPITVENAETYVNIAKRSVGNTVNEANGKGAGADTNAENRDERQPANESAKTGIAEVDAALSFVSR